MRLGRVYSGRMHGYLVTMLGLKYLHTSVHATPVFLKLHSEF